MAKDPYAVLGVEPGSTEQEIRAAYRQRARTEHPDINDAPNAEVLGGVGWLLHPPRFRWGFPKMVVPNNHGFSY